MKRTIHPTRRQAIAGAATGATAFIAGCGDLGEEESPDDDPDAEEGTGNGQDVEDGDDDHDAEEDDDGNDAEAADDD